jgi:hypothetical protein
VEANSHHRDAGQVMRYLPSPMLGMIVDMAHSVTEDYPMPRC